MHIGIAGLHIRTVIMSRHRMQRTEKRHLYTSFLKPNSIGKRGRGSSWVLSWLPRVVRWRNIVSSKIVDTVLSASLKGIVKIWSKLLSHLSRISGFPSKWRRYLNLESVQTGLSQSSVSTMLPSTPNLSYVEQTKLATSLPMYALLIRVLLRVYLY